jgi:hypothetical protein
MYVVDTAIQCDKEIGGGGDNDPGVCMSSFDGRTSWHRENKIELLETFQIALLLLFGRSGTDRMGVL